MKQHKRFRSEDNLYRAVCTGFDVFTRRFEGTKMEECIGSEALHAEQTYLGGKTLYIIGEVHNSKAPVDYVHTVIVPKMEKSPGAWMMLKEAAGTYVASVFSAPAHFYFQELAEYFGLPYLDPLEDIGSEKVRSTIRHACKVSDEDIERFVTCQVIKPYSELTTGVDGSRSSGHDEIIIKGVMRHFRKSRDYAERLITAGPLPFEVEFAIGDAWNSISRANIDKILGEYSSKAFVLVEVGNAHVPIFETQNSGSKIEPTE
ncbi:MAG: hypothetical protein HY513_01550 [Candidatus Aenigmarchaeota archaeon]|nr:hypothetical protein [Candidatus Aenigmarchaeota archaeon]